MAHFRRGKQTGIQNDLSAGLGPELFVLDHIAQYGINSQIVALAYDPVQSLLAIGTKESAFGSGQLYVFGQKRVFTVFTLPRKASVKVLQFCVNKIISLDSKNDIAIFSLETKQLSASYAPPGIVSALLTDPTLDYALVGLQNGDVIAYDLDRQALAPFKIANLWKERNSRTRLLPIVSLALHPRDIGTLLVGYPEGAVVYSFKQNKPVKFYQFILQPGAPGGQLDPTSLRAAQYPKLMQALWHPTGTFILTGHEDSSLVFWDSKDGRVIQARTLQDTNIDRPVSIPGHDGSMLGTVSVNAPILRLAWCSKQNPDDTSILVAGGMPTTMPSSGLTFLDLGPTPVYATASWQILTEHFENPKRQHVLPTPLNAEIVDFCLIPRSSPHFAGSCDPIALIALLASGEIITMSFPSGHAITPTNQLHASLSFVHPFVNKIALACVDRVRWLGMTEKRSRGPQILRGGAEATHPLKRYEQRNIIQTAHADGTLRIWDAGHGDEIENENMVQADVARAIGRFDEIDITEVSMSCATGELAIGLRSGEVAIFRWGNNRYYGQEVSHVSAESFGLEAIADRGDPSVREGLLPLTLLNQRRSPVTALKTSDVGFVAAGFEDGGIAVIDLRGPALIYSASLYEFTSTAGRHSIRRNSSQSQAKHDQAKTMEFGVLSIDGEDYSSILLFVGTNLGRVITFKLLPELTGGYSVQLVGMFSLDAKIVSLVPISSITGKSANASQSAVAKLRDGYKVDGVLVAISQSGAKILKPGAAKGASKMWDQFFCDSANVVGFEDSGYVLIGLFGDGCARAYSIPGLKEIASTKVNHSIDVRRFPEAIITSTGDIFGWVGPSEIALLNVWGTGQGLMKSSDNLFNPDALIPPRPTISNIQWISGTQYVTPSDMDILIGGPDRPPSKRMIEQMRSEEQQRRAASRSAPPAASSANGQDESYWEYMQRQMQERTEKLNIMGDSMERLEENSSGWADDVGKYIHQQKKKAVMGLISSKLGF